MMNQQDRAALLDWIPYRLLQEEGQAMCRWLYVGEKQFTEPFFDSTIGMCQMAEQNSKLKRTLSDPETLKQWKQYADPVAPGALIFHVSRCGSTLVSQLLAASEENIVLSEVPFFDEVLMGRAGVDMPLPDVELLSAAIAFHTHKRHAAQQRFFIKVDSWHMFYYNEYRSLFPSLPLILLYREPAAVIRSQLKQAGMHAVPGLAPSRLFDFKTRALTREAYMGAVLEKYYQQFLSIAQRDTHAVLVNYVDGAMSMIETINEAAGITPTEEQRAAWRERSQYHAKFPDKSFNGDDEIKVDPANFSAAIEAYEALEAWRLSNK
ncbi:hypothetical protein JMG10_07445 [Nostoc ellipsosporum NOK]|nr:hypothetical protein [Nostoc ellipsosporum NOK]